LQTRIALDPTVRLSDVGFRVIYIEH